MKTADWIKPLLIILVTFISLSACQFESSARPASANKNKLRVETKSPGILKRYDSFYVADVSVYSIEGDHLRRIDDREVQDLAEEFRTKLIRSLGSRHSPIPQPAYNTAVIKVALTDVSTNYAALQIVPGFLVPNAMRGGASIEATVVDSVTNQPIARMTDSREGERQGFLSGFGKWDGTKRAFDEWAQMLSGAVRN